MEKDKIVGYTVLVLIIFNSITGIIMTLNVKIYAHSFVIHVLKYVGWSILFSLLSLKISVIIMIGISVILMEIGLFKKGNTNQMFILFGIVSICIFLLAIYHTFVQHISLNWI